MRNPLKVLWQKFWKWRDKVYYDNWARQQGYEDYADYLLRKFGIGKNA